MDKELLESVQERMQICSGIGRELADELGRIIKGDYPESLVGETKDQIKTDIAGLIKELSNINGLIK